MTANRRTPAAAVPGPGAGVQISQRDLTVGHDFDFVRHGLQRTHLGDARRRAASDEANLPTQDDELFARRPNCFTVVASKVRDRLEVRGELAVSPMTSILRLASRSSRWLDYT